MSRERHKLFEIFRKWALVIVIILLCAIFGYFEPVFLGGENIINIIRQTAILGILAFGLSFVIISGEMDLSFAMVASLSAITVLYLEISGTNTWMSWILALLIGLICGVINAFIVIKLKLPSMLGTIGTQLFFGGITAWIAKGATVWTSKYSMTFTMPGRGMLFGIIPIPIVILAVIATCTLVLLEKTVLGRYFYAVGGNASAADHAGISAMKIKGLSFVIMGVLAALAGIIMSSQYASATPTVGSSFLFPAIIAVFLGSIFLKDGVPNAWGTLIGCLFIAVLSNGFSLVGLKYWHEDTAKGLLMVLAIGFTLLGKKAKK